MISEKQKYISGLFKNIGFAFFAPVGSITFQWLVLQKGPYLGHVIHSVIVFLAGVLFIVFGYTALKERK